MARWIHKEWGDTMPCNRLPVELQEAIIEDILEGRRLKEMARSFSHQAIAKRYHISPNTVTAYARTLDE